MSAIIDNQITRSVLYRGTEYYREQLIARYGNFDAVLTSLSQKGLRNKLFFNNKLFVFSRNDLDAIVKQLESSGIEPILLLRALQTINMIRPGQGKNIEKIKLDRLAETTKTDQISLNELENLGVIEYDSQGPINPALSPVLFPLQVFRVPVLEQEGPANVTGVPKEQEAQLLAQGYVPVWHLTLKHSVPGIVENGLTVGDRVKLSDFYIFFSVSSPDQGKVQRRDVVFAYPDMADALPRYEGKMHLGRFKIKILVRPDAVMVADASHVERFVGAQGMTESALEHLECKDRNGGNESHWTEYNEFKEVAAVVQSTKDKAARSYHDTAVTLEQYMRYDPGFTSPEVLIPPGAQAFFVIPEEESYQLELWEQELFNVVSNAYHKNLKTHSLEHTLRVVENARELARKTCLQHLSAVIAGAYLHDIGRRDDRGGSEHAVTGAKMAPDFLPPGLTALERETILFAISHHADTKAPNGGSPVVGNYPEIEERGLLKDVIAVIWDADRLDIKRIDRVRKEFLSTKAAADMI